jgi:hypothetical protein
MRYLHRLALVVGAGVLFAAAAGSAHAQEPYDFSDMGAITDTEGLDDLHAWLAALDAQKTAAPPAAEVEQPAAPAPSQAPAAVPQPPSGGAGPVLQLPSAGAGHPANAAPMLAIALLLLAGGMGCVAAARTVRT